MDDVVKFVGALFAIVIMFLVVFGIVFSPFIVVWAINALGFSVAYSFKTWLAGLILILIFGPGLKTRS